MEFAAELAARFEVTTQVFDDGCVALTRAMDRRYGGEVLVLSTPHHSSNELIHMQGAAFLATFDSFYIDGRDVFILESFKGRTLTSLVESKQVLQPQVAFRILEQLAGGLDLVPSRCPWS